MHVLKALGIAGLASLIGACGAPGPREVRDPYPAVRNGRSIEALEELKGSYTVVDSRLNAMGADLVKLEVIGGVPTLSMVNQKTPGSALRVQANECYGMIDNGQMDTNIFCLGRAFGNTVAPMISITRVVHRPITNESGGIFPLFKPMQVNSGYLISYVIGNSRGAPERRYLAAIKQD